MYARFFALIPCALTPVLFCSCDARDVEFREGGAGASATGGSVTGEAGVGGAPGGGSGGRPASGGDGGTAGSGGAPHQGGTGGNGGLCPEGYAIIDDQGGCYADASCFELADGRWCTGGGIEIDCDEKSTVVFFDIGVYECLSPEACAPGFGPAPDQTACPPNGTCYQLLDGTWCAQWRTEDRCPTGFTVVESSAECDRDARCYELADGAWCTGDDSRLDPAVFDALALYGFEVSGEPDVLPLQLPQDPMATAQWGVVEEECRMDGFSLVPYAGELVNLTRYDINRTCDGYRVDLRLMTHGETLLCAYYTVRPPEEITPGVFALGRPQCR